MNELVSIIVPIYNKGNYLRRCINSIVLNTYKNIEILLVDDGSTDNSSSLCKEFEILDGRIRYYKKDNGGVSSARNFGVDRANGDFVVFVDADDYVKPFFVENLMKAASDSIDMILEYSYNVNEDGTEHVYQQYTNECIIDINNGFDFIGEKMHFSIWGILFKKTMLNDIKFDEDLFVGEDTLFYAKILKKCKRIKYIKERDYVYVYYAESSVNGTLSEKKITELIAWERIALYYSDWPLTQQTILKGYVARFFGLYSKAVYQNKPEFQNLLVKLLNRNFSVVFDCKLITIKEKLIILTILVIPHVYCLYSVIKRKRYEFKKENCNFHNTIDKLRK